MSASSGNLSGERRSSNFLSALLLDPNIPIETAKTDSITIIRPLPQFDVNGGILPMVLKVGPTGMEFSSIHSDRVVNGQGAEGHQRATLMAKPSDCALTDERAWPWIQLFMRAKGFVNGLKGVNVPPDQQQIAWMVNALVSKPTGNGKGFSAPLNSPGTMVFIPCYMFTVNGKQNQNQNPTPGILAMGPSGAKAISQFFTDCHAKGIDVFHPQTGYSLIIRGIAAHAAAVPATQYSAGLPANPGETAMIHVDIQQQTPLPAGSGWEGWAKALELPKCLNYLPTQAHYQALRRAYPEWLLRKFMEQETVQYTGPLSPVQQAPVQPPGQQGFYPQQVAQQPWQQAAPVPQQQQQPVQPQGGFPPFQGPVPQQPQVQVQVPPAGGPGTWAPVPPAGGGWSPAPQQPVVPAPQPAPTQQAWPGQPQAPQQAAPVPQQAPWQPTPTMPVPPPAGGQAPWPQGPAPGQQPAPTQQAWPGQPQPQQPAQQAAPPQPQQPWAPAGGPPAGTWGTPPVPGQPQPPAQQGLIPPPPSAQALADQLANQIGQPPAGQPPVR